MNKFIIFVGFLTLLLVEGLTPVLAATNEAATSVEARVGEYYLDLSGFASPYASIVLTSDGKFLRSATADAQGNFFISKVSIQEGFTSFCLETIDFKRVGSSLTCFTIPPAKGSVTKQNIFLPPTIGVSGKKLYPGESIFAFGYTMPGALVTLHLGKINLTATADNEGYYKIEIKDLDPGSYSIFATASLGEKESEKPENEILIESLSKTGAAVDRTSGALRGFLKQLFSILQLLMKYIWIVFPILILIIILIAKKLKERSRAKELIIKRRGKKGKETMHHYWMFGY